MSPEARPNFPTQLRFLGEEFESVPIVVSASRRTELVGLRPNWLVNALQRFERRYKRNIHSVVLWTKDPTNIYEHKELREELSKYNLLVHFTLTGLGGTRIEPTVPEPEVLVDRLPKLLEFLKDPRRLRWRFDPIITLQKEDGDYWLSSVLFEPLAQEISKLGVNNCYFSFCSMYPKIARRGLEESGIKMVMPSVEEQLEVVEQMKNTASPLGITLYSCVQPLLEGVRGITPARCIDAELLTDLHPQKIPADQSRDKTQSKYRETCYCTESRDIGAYLPCGHGCVYCYAEAAVPIRAKLTQKPLPWESNLEL